MSMEWIWIGVIIIVLIFGAKKLPQLARSFGRAKGDYEKGRIESEKDLKEKTTFDNAKTVLTRAQMLLTKTL